MGRLSVKLLGPFEVRLDDALVTEFGYDKVRALLAYLMAEAGHPHRRVRLIGLLWPNYPERSARQNLSQALFTLRNAIEDAVGPEGETEYLYATRQTVEFEHASDFWLDVAAFDAAIKASAAHAHPPHGAGAVADLEPDVVVRLGQRGRRHVLTHREKVLERRVIQVEP